MQHRRQSAEEMRNELRSAFSAALGGHSDVQQAHLQYLRRKFSSTWKALAKNTDGNVDKRSLRYIVHRHFMQEYHLSIAGLEPAQVNTSHEEVVLLTEFAPQFVREVLQEDVAQAGYSFEDIITMVAAIERMLEGTTRNIVSEAFEQSKCGSQDLLSVDDAMRVLEMYAGVWILGEVVTPTHDMSEDGQPEDIHENWEDILDFIWGQIESFQHFNRFSVADPQKSRTWNPLRPMFSFEDIESIAARMTMEFGRYWEGECSRIKNLLVDMDGKGSGRVPLPEFYAAATRGEWRFSESESYLRQLGALDETSSWSGPQLILTNYLQGSSNCIISADHYRVCCANECEYILDEIEEAVGGPLGDPQQIIRFVQHNVTASLESSGVRVMSKMRKQLQEIAAGNGGQIPIHGRLFAQWLHYVLPHQCPFPHKAGSTVALTPSQYGQDHVASMQEMREYVRDARSNRGGSTVGQNDERLSQWSHEEEHLSVHTQLSEEKHKPWMWVYLPLLSALGVAAKFGLGQSDRSTKGATPMNVPYFKAHAV